MSAATWQPFRLKDGGRINRDQPLTVRFNGKPMPAFAGDTLASALLANGVHMVGRSFKYHRPRGILGAWHDEPNALATIGKGARQDVNTRMTVAEVYDGLEARSQNHWPSLGFDIGAMNGWLSPLFPAGFYYKTFMGRGLPWWMFFEKFIRQAAGLGPAPADIADADGYEHTHAHCDVLVVGGGPAGLSAALTAGRSGARVILCEDQAELGGSLLHESDLASIDGQPVGAWLAHMRSELAACADMRVLTRTQCAGYFDHNYLSLCERVTDHLGPDAPAHLPRQRLWKVRAGQVVLATGALERPLTFAHNDRPGIMLAGAVRSYLNRYAVRSGGACVVATNNDSAYATALDLRARGLHVEAIVDARPAPTGGLVDRARDDGVRIIHGAVITSATGGSRVNGVHVQTIDADGRLTGKEEELHCDHIAMSGGWNPTVHLFSQSRGKLGFDQAYGMFTPADPFQAARSAGACNGELSLSGALNQGAEAGRAAAADAGFDAAPLDLPKVEEVGQGEPRLIWLCPSPKPKAARKAFVDFQNDVTAGDIRLAVQEGFRSVEHVKRYTTNGMATDQGKLSNVTALGLMAEKLDAQIPEIGTTTFRPPYTPLTFGALVGANTKELFDPLRTTPMHSWHVAHGAEWEDVGQWRRARYYPKSGEDYQSALNREVAAARNQIGILDASTLGKIDIQGRDAGEFLNRIYTNAWSKLEIGRCRYGIMCKDDGMIFDDGVTARIDDHRYLMSTTTGGAARVLAWLEEWLQTEWPELKVYCTSVTEQWATASICGPKARDLLARLCTDIDLSPEAFPFMTWRDGTVAGIPARVMRISFTGELSFEINVPSGYGLSLWETLMAEGEDFGITPYGTEAMHVLRAEKGFIIVGQDTDGTATPYDMGMDWIVSKKKPDFIGKRSFARADMQRADRKQLVGIVAKDASESLEEGAHLVEKVTEPPLVMLGHISSAYYSPSLGKSFGLAMIRGGRARMGQTLLMPLIDRVVDVEVVEPVFLDAEGERMRA